MAGRHARKQSPESMRLKRHKAVRIGIPTTLGALLILGGAAYYRLNRPLTHDVQYPAYTTPSNTTTNAITTPVAPPEPSRQTVLVIGTDTRPGETGGNTDVLILASIDPKNKRIELLSVPRDTKVTYPNGSSAKINEGLMLGGPTLTKSVVSQLTGQHIDNYALTHFGGLVQIINTIGGITLNVPERMYYNTGDTEYNIINLHPGVQTLNGAQALGFVRFRHDALGDIGRTQRQQEFLQALSDKLLQPQNITKLPTLVREFWGTMDTDMSTLNVLQLAANANTYRGYQIIHETLPGSFHNPDPKIRNDVSYWIVNPLEAKYMATQFFENGLIQKNPVQDPSVTENWKTPSEPANKRVNGLDNGTTNGNSFPSDPKTQSAPTADINEGKRASIGWQKTTDARS
ncbi:LCP family protein [Alicyclobacillus ferrooxydans]|uniref:LCP family protein n=1 Tax=Alicyclobacillus ferrooxydans TaxID=471514 RepID=UPI0006D56740|nr:LCP family protein [Alicyclobacillus ferrooxydans]